MFPLRIGMLNICHVLVFSHSASMAEITIHRSFLLRLDWVLGSSTKLHTSSHDWLFRVGTSETSLDKNNLFYMRTFISAIHNTVNKSFKSRYPITVTSLWSVPFFYSYCFCLFQAFIIPHLIFYNIPLLFSLPSVLAPLFLPTHC